MTIEDFKLLLDALMEYRWYFFCILFVIFFRIPIGKLLSRLINLKLSSSSDGSFQLEAQAEPEAVVRELPRIAAAVPEGQAVEDAILEKEHAKDWLTECEEALRRGEVEQADKIFESYQNTLENADEAYSKRSTYLFFKFQIGKDDHAIQQLHEHLTKANENQLLETSKWLSLCLEDMQDYTGMEALAHAGLEKSNIESERTEFTIMLAEAFKFQGKYQAGINVLEMRLKQSSPEEAACLFLALSKLEEANNNLNGASLAFEKAIELLPHDRKRLFDAAYLEGNGNLPLLSLKNYEKLLSIDGSHSLALNNLGARVKEMGLKGKAISLYQQSAALNESLAKANMAYELIDAGFYEQAQEILDAARLETDPHENIAKAIAHLEAKKQEEDKKWDKVVKRASEFQCQIRSYAGAYFDSSSADIDFSGTWRIDGSGVEIFMESDSDGLISCEWETQVENAFAKRIVVTNHKIVGRIRNRSASLGYKSNGGEARGLLGIRGDKNISCYSYLTEDKSTWKIFSAEEDQEFSMTLIQVA